MEVSIYTCMRECKCVFMEGICTWRRTEVLVYILNTTSSVCRWESLCANV